MWIRRTQYPAMCGWRVKRNFEEHFPHQNWFIVISFQLLISTVFAVMTPSIYQYVTTGDSIQEEHKNSQGRGRFWAGLGGSDTDYAWVVAASSIFEAGATPLTAITAYRLPFTFILFIFVALAVVGGGIYALACNVWMAFVGRGLMGAGCAFGAAAVHTYIGEMGIVMDDIRKKKGKKPKKFILYIALSFTLNVGMLIPYALNSILARFKDLNPYRWPGWSVTVLAIVLGLIVLFCFTETRALSCAKASPVTCSGLSGLKLSAQLRSKWKMRFLCHIFLIACGYVVGQVYGFVSTLVAPVLSDKFGFNVEYTSHFFIGVSCVFFTTTIIHLGTKIARMDNRILLGLCLLLVLVGSVLVGDWRSIEQDPCLSATANKHNTSSVLGLSSGTASGFGSGVRENETFDLMLEECVARHQCFWNPQSRITGQFCNTCRSVCLSKETTTVDFYQFSIGVLLLSLSAPLGFVFASAVGSQITSLESQGAVLSLILGSGALGRAVSPVWFVESYELTGRHTYLAMSISAGCGLVLLLLQVALYKNLAPVSKQKDNELIVDATLRQPDREKDLPEQLMVVYISSSMRSLLLL